ncbi:MAG TPA: UDP-glucose/GDP-mannose dehydrogenase family protein [Candidatus Acidoferrum sp.]|nr:UDP-glucose/GDP-mannose dehydrogenase family protein [Candidatus Acidoferrum sp.]
MRIAVIGSGYVGLVSAACFAEIGHEVHCVDNNESKIAMLQRGEVPIHELHLPELLERHRGRALKFSTSVTDAVEKADAVFITVGTPPSVTGEADLSFVEAVAIEIASAIRGRKVIVEKSTVPVRTCEWLRKSLSLNGAQPGSFSVASNPEFLREGTAVSDFLYPDRIVVGADDEFSATVLQKIYEPLTTGRYYSQKEVIPAPASASPKARIIVTNAKSAELIKHASNAFLAMKISFVNALANVAESVGADITEVCAGVGSDSRIGPRFLNAGIGYGGSCFPKDVQAFQAVANNCGCDFGILTEVMRVNTEQRRLFLKKVRSALWTLRGKKLAVLGLAFKAETDDVRESPAIEIIEALLREGAQVRAYDPAAIAKSKELLRAGGIEYAKDAYDAMDGSDALVILTEWREFSSLDLNRVRSLLKYPIVIDGRNLYKPHEMADAGLIYHSIGRAVGTPKDTCPVEAEVNSSTALPAGSPEAARHAAFPA